MTSAKQSMMRRSKMRKEKAKEGSITKMTKRNSWNNKIMMGMLAFVLVLFLGLTSDAFSFVSQAQSQGKVTASSANIRKEPSANSQSLGSAANGAAVTINGQTTGSDGKVWYQVFVNADTLGYIRSDLVSITDGTTPDTLDGSQTSGGDTAQDGVEAVEPVSASVKGGNRVRVRAAATTDSSIVTAVENGSALTVNGRTTGTDGNVWYHVAFIENGTEVAGFIRYDFVELSGELVPVVTEEPDTTEPDATETVPEPEVTKDWETQLQGEDWYLLDMANNGQYKISDIFAAVNTNKAAYEEAQKTVKSQKLVIVILIIVILALGGAAAFLVYKIKDMMDSAYYHQVEKETLRRRSSNEGTRPQPGQKVMHTVGGEKKPAGTPQGTKQAAPQGSRPAGAPQGVRQAAPQGSRPAGAPQGAKPGAPQGVKPAAPQGAQPAAKPENAEVKPQETKAANPQPQPQNRKPKNFVADEDEFEFEFLNWDGEEEQ